METIVRPAHTVPPVDTAQAEQMDSLRKRWNSQIARMNGDKPGIEGLMGLTEHWKLARDYLYPVDLRIETGKQTDGQAVKEAFDSLGGNRLLGETLEAYVLDMRKQQHMIEEEVGQIMTLYNQTNDVTLIKNLVYRLGEWWKAWSPQPELGSVLTSNFSHEFQMHLFSILPPSFASAFKALCQSTFTSTNSIGAPEPEPSLWNCFDQLGFIDRYENLIATVCYEQIEWRVKETCCGVWSERMLPGVRDWMANTIVPWMIHPYAKGAKTMEEQRLMLQGIGSRFDFHVCKTLCDLRTSEIFDIIVDFPESSPALLDLKECLQRVDQRAELVSSLRKLNRKRLLHPGADTKDILGQYVSMIRCLRVVDPPGVLLYKVADPVRRYLRERPDTIKSIVASLVGEGGDLVDENEAIQPLQTNVDDFSDPNWEPEAIDAGPDFRTNKPSDVISTLVSIYDSKDLFVKELQVLLAQRLLAITDGNFEKERRNIEILKVRFGEAQLQVCEVMLRDMTDSKRIDHHVQMQKPSVIHPTIISKHFWPALQSSKLVMPGQLKGIIDAYSHEYTLFKPDKKLRWLPQLGTVDVIIELRDRTLEVRVTPVEAGVAELFSEKPQWTVDDLSKTLQVDTASIRKAILTWLDHGVLRETDESGTSYTLLEDTGSEGIVASGSGRNMAQRQGVVEEQEAPVGSAQQQEAEQMRVYWKFIEGMLTNLGALPLDRIQTMLKFAPGYSRSVEQLGAFMEAARREGLVTVSSGMWKLNR